MMQGQNYPSESIHLNKFLQIMDNHFCHLGECCSSFMQSKLLFYNYLPVYWQIVKQQFIIVIVKQNIYILLVEFSIGPQSHTMYVMS